jgi:hypothetical protein
MYGSADRPVDHSREQPVSNPVLRQLVKVPDLSAQGSRPQETVRLAGLAGPRTTPFPQPSSMTSRPRTLPSTTVSCRYTDLRICARNR